MISIDVATGRNLQAGGTSFSWSHTCTGNKLRLFAGITIGTSDLVTGVTYNGVAMTLVDKVQTPSGRFSYLYFLDNPATGANNIVASTSGAPDFFLTFSASYTGVLQSGTIDSKNTGTATGVDNLQLSTTSVADNCWTIMYGDNTDNNYDGGTATFRATPNSQAIGDSNGVIHPAGSTSLKFSVSTGSGNFGQIIASFAPDTSSPSASASPSLSPSASSSPSGSLSPSASGSASASRSLSPSASSSPSNSASLSPSASGSPSLSPSASGSASTSPSASKSPSGSTSPSPSSSISASPSQGFEDFTREQNLSLPTNDNDLSTIYTGQEVIDVSTYDGVSVGQVGDLKYMIHQFKVFRDGNDDPTVLCRGHSTLDATLSAIYLQIYNHLTNSWETLDIDDSTHADTDFRLAGDIMDFTNYRNSQNLVSCRAWQLAI